MLERDDVIMYASVGFHNANCSKAFISVPRFQSKRFHSKISPSKILATTFQENML